MNDSILESIKKLLGIDSSYNVFDKDLIMLINGVLMTLEQIGIGPIGGFSITSDAETWSQFMTNVENIEAVKTYVYLQVRMTFDPPTSSFVLDSMRQTCDELIWRLNVQVD